MVSRLGSLVQSCCGEGGALQTNVTGLCVGRTHSVPATPGLPPFMGVCFPRLHCSGSRLLYLEGPCVACGSSSRVLHKSVDSVGPAFCVFPRPGSSGRQELDGRTLPGCDAPFPLRGLAQPQFLCTSSVHSPCVCSRELASSRDPPSGCRPSRISGSLWLETGGLFAVW